MIAFAVLNQNVSYQKSTITIFQFSPILFIQMRGSLFIFLLLFFPFFFLIIPNQIVWLLEQNTKTTIKNVWPINKDNFPTNQWFCKSSDCDMIRVNLPKKNYFHSCFFKLMVCSKSYNFIQRCFDIRIYSRLFPHLIPSVFKLTNGKSLLCNLIDNRLITHLCLSIKLNMYQNAGSKRIFLFYWFTKTV